MHTYMHTYKSLLSFFFFTDKMSSHLSSWLMSVWLVIESSLYWPHRAMQSKIFLKPHLNYYQFFNSRATNLADRVGSSLEDYEILCEYKYRNLKSDNDFNPIVMTFHHNMTTARLCWSWETAWKLTDYGLFVLSRQRISLLSAKFTSKWNGVESYRLQPIY